MIKKVTIDDLAGMFQREFSSLHKKIDSFREFFTDQTVEIKEHMYAQEANWREDFENLEEHVEQNETDIKALNTIVFKKKR